MTGFADRLVTLMKQKAVSQADIMRATGAGKATISNWVNGNQMPRGEYLFALAERLDCNPQWLLHGSDQEAGAAVSPNKVIAAQMVSQDEDYILVNQYDVAASCGDGANNSEELIKGGLLFKRKWLKRKGYAPGKLAVIHFKDVSMLPTIDPDSVGLLNLDDSEPSRISNGKIYALVDDGQLRAKRIFYSADRQELILRSDNPDKIRYPDEVVTIDQARQIGIVGRVVWRGGDV